MLQFVKMTSYLTKNEHLYWQEWNDSQQMHLNNTNLNILLSARLRLRHKRQVAHGDQKSICIWFFMVNITWINELWTQSTRSLYYSNNKGNLFSSEFKKKRRVESSEGNTHAPNLMRLCFSLCWFLYITYSP